MPKAAPSRCTAAGCNTLTTKGRCDLHRRKAWANTSARNKRLDRSTWKRAADAHLVTEPLCRACGADRRLQVDHITEVADGGALYDESNLQTLCEDCHDAKTEAAKALRKRLQDLADLDSW